MRFHREETNEKAEIDFESSFEIQKGGTVFAWFLVPSNRVRGQSLRWRILWQTEFGSAGKFSGWSTVYGETSLDYQTFYSGRYGGALSHFITSAQFWES